MEQTVMAIAQLSNSVFGAIVVVTFAVVVLDGCAMSQEGAVDFRKASLSKQATRQGTIKTIEKTPIKEPVLPARMVRKFVAAPQDKNAAIKSGDSITIRLGQAFIKDFWELGLFSPHRGFRSNGEIAIVVNAFEYDSNDKGKDFNFGPEGLRQGRLVFFSSDVEENQPLNLANMPIYGPITYTGNPIGIQIFILEIDANTEQVKALLTSLASAGANAYPPSSPVLSLLDKLGTALLEGGTDDTEFRFTFVLDPLTSYTGLAYPRVEARNYVFIRERNRQANTPWDKLFLDENNGGSIGQESLQQRKRRQAMQVNPQMASGASTETTPISLFKSTRDSIPQESIFPKIPLDIS